MRRWHGVIGLVLTLGVLVFLAYRLDLPALHRALAGAQYAYVLPLLGTTFLLYGVGALQWRLVLSPVTWVRPLRLFGAQMVGALVQGLLHVPVGGLVQAYVVARRERVSLNAVLAIAVIVEVVSHGTAMAVGLVCLWVEGFTLDELRGLRVRWQGSQRKGLKALRPRSGARSHGPVREQRQT